MQCGNTETTLQVVNVCSLTAILWSLPGPTWRLSTGDHKVDQCSSWMMEAELSHHMAWLHLSTWLHESLNLCGHILLDTEQKRRTLVLYAIYMNCRY